MVIYGSNSDASWYANTEPAVTKPVAVSSTLTWYETASTNFVPYRYVYACNPNRSWSLTVTELQFYGWPATATDGYAIGAVELSAVQSGSAVVLSWKDNGYGTTFNVERSVDGGMTWAVLASGLSATSCTDADISCDGTEYLYRIASVNGNATSYSATARCVPYVHGDGEGLHKAAVFPFTTTAPAENAAEYVSTGAVDIAAATLAEARPLIDGVEGSHTNVYVAWTGKLIVPFAGSYIFTAKADGMVSVYIDGASIVRYSAGSGLREMASAAHSLTAGDHDLRVLYWQGADASGCTLSWSGAVEKEVIPASQLKPVVPNTLPAPWEGVQMFSSSAAVYNPCDWRANTDGTVDLAFAGADSRQDTCSFISVWRPLCGDFTMTTKLTYLPSSRVAGEKAGLMVRAGLSMDSPFELFLLRSNNGGDLALRSRRAVGGGVVEPLTVDALGSKAAWGVAYRGNATIHMRLRREGPTFTFAYKAPETADWTTIYEYVDTNGLYGDTVYIGPAACNVIFSDWETSPYRASRYAWRFSEIGFRKPIGMAISVK